MKEIILLKTDSQHLEKAKIVTFYPATEQYILEPINTWGFKKGKYANQPFVMVNRVDCFDINKAEELSLTYNIT